MKENILIIGGGAAGMEAATQLHKMGLNPIIVEKSEALGGHIAQWVPRSLTSIEIIIVSMPF